MSAVNLFFSFRTYSLSSNDWESWGEFAKCFCFRLNAPRKRFEALLSDSASPIMLIRIPVFFFPSSIFKWLNRLWLSAPLSALNQPRSTSLENILDDRRVAAFLTRWSGERRSELWYSYFWYCCPVCYANLRMPTCGQIPSKNGYYIKLCKHC